MDNRYYSNIDYVILVNEYQLFPKDIVLKYYDTIMKSTDYEKCRELMQNYSSAKVYDINMDGYIDTIVMKEVHNWLPNPNISVMLRICQIIIIGVEILIIILYFIFRKKFMKLTKILKYLFILLIIISGIIIIKQQTISANDILRYHKENYKYYYETRGRYMMD